MKSFSCNFNDIWIIGGSSVYQEFIKREMNTELSKYYITYIDKDYECDTYFPFLENMNKYHITRFEKQKCIDNNTHDKTLLNVYYQKYATEHNPRNQYFHYQQNTFLNYLILSLA